MSVKPSFSGHETFPPRYGWAAKAVQGVCEDSGLFLRDDALDRLGVGKNMVRSIRFWGEALGLLVRQGDAEVVTPLGSTLCSRSGWDPYLEISASLWLLHWHLVRGPFETATWHLVFTQWSADLFQKTEILEWLHAKAQGLGARATLPSLKRDLDVFLRTYLPSSKSRGRSLEESFDSPWVELGLLLHTPEGYRFNRGPKPSLPDPVFHYALLDYWDRHARERQSLSFENLLYGPGSPGMAFRLDEPGLTERLERLAPLGLSYDETAGRRAIFGKPDLDPQFRLNLLATYYLHLTQEGSA